MRTQAAIAPSAIHQPAIHQPSAAVPGGELANALNTVGATRLVERGAELYAEGAAADSWYQVRTGMIRLCKLMPDGRRQIEAFLLPGDFFGFEPGNEHSFAAEAVTDSVVVAYRRSRIDQLTASNPSLMQRLLTLAIKQLCEAQQKLVLLGRKTATERLACFILEMLERSGGTRVVNLPMSRTDIADYLGLTTETVSRLFTALRQDGILDLPHPHRLVVQDREALEEISDGAQ
jgi:CRP-like cAMP-binding protein